MPSLGAVLIVKNEAERIERCLVSAKAAGVDVVTVVDTGSTDDTQEIIRRVCSDIDLRLSEAPFVNFGQARSVAFERARESADWLLALDADMTVEIDWDKFESNPRVDAYMIEMGSSDFSYRLPLLLRGGMPWISRGAVHEYTLLEDGTLGRRAPTDAVKITLHGGDRSSPEKTRWQMDLLLGYLEEHPDDPRTIFYLGQTARELGDSENALIYYQRRAGMGGWEEERWYAQYRAALLQSWPARMAALTAAWEARPSRLEPLYALVQELNLRDLHWTAYQLLQGIATNALPIDTLFVHRSVWDWGIDFQRSLAAYYVGRKGEARSLGARLLTNASLPPNMLALVAQNLTFTREMVRPTQTDGQLATQ